MMTNLQRMKEAARRRGRIILLRDRYKWTFQRIGLEYGFSKQRAQKLYAIGKNGG